MTVPAPIGLLAELTHRCPLQCAYCSNPVQLDRRQLEMQTGDWLRVFSEANDLGVLQVHLSGGEPTARDDLEQIIGHCAKLELYTNLITSGVMLNGERLKAIADQGLDHVQLSLQDVDPLNADQIGGFKGGHAKKLALGAAVVKLGLPLTVNAVIHRHNIQNISEMVQLALDMGAKRVEIAHVQYYGWALKNRAHLMPTREQAVAVLRYGQQQIEQELARIVADVQAQRGSIHRVDFKNPDVIIAIEIVGNEVRYRYDHETAAARLRWSRRRRTIRRAAERI
ncbi:MAG: radical SAM protein [Rhizobiales bacterium]|nr:radical SAM protein [Hyphomicrobiales bacterium]